MAPGVSPVEGNLPFQARAGENVCFYYQEGQWRAEVSSRIGDFSRQVVLPVVCSSGEDAASTLEVLSRYPSSQRQRQLHVLDRNVCPTLGEVVYVGELGLKGGGNTESSMGGGDEDDGDSHKSSAENDRGGSTLRVSRSSSSGSTRTPADTKGSSFTATVDNCLAIERAMDSIRSGSSGLGATPAATRGSSSTATVDNFRAIERALAIERAMDSIRSGSSGLGATPAATRGSSSTATVDNFRAIERALAIERAMDSIRSGSSGLGATPAATRGPSSTDYRSSGQRATPAAARGSSSTDYRSSGQRATPAAARGSSSTDYRSSGQRAMPAAARGSSSTDYRSSGQRATPAAARTMQFTAGATSSVHGATPTAARTIESTRGLGSSSHSLPQGPPSQERSIAALDQCLASVSEASKSCQVDKTNLEQLARDVQATHKAAIQREAACRLEASGARDFCLYSEYKKISQTADKYQEEVDRIKKVLDASQKMLRDLPKTPEEVLPGSGGDSSGVAQQTEAQPQKAEPSPGESAKPEQAAEMLPGDTMAPEQRGNEPSSLSQGSTGNICEISNLEQRQAKSTEASKNGKVDPAEVEQLALDAQATRQAKIKQEAGRSLIALGAQERGLYSEYEKISQTADKYQEEVDRSKKVLDFSRNMLGRPGTPTFREKAVAAAKGVGKSFYHTGEAVVKVVDVVLGSGVDLLQDTITGETSRFSERLQKGNDNLEQVGEAVIEYAKQTLDYSPEAQVRRQAEEETRKQEDLERQALDAEGYHLDAAEQAGYIVGEVTQLAGPAIVKSVSKLTQTAELTTVLKEGQLVGKMLAGVSKTEKFVSEMGSGAKVAQAGQGLEETVVIAQEGSMAAQKGKLASKMGSGAKVAQAGQGLEETVVVAQEGSMAAQEGKLASKMGSGAKVAQAGQGLEEAVVVAQEGSMAAQEGKLASKMGSGAKVAQAGQGLEETVVVAQEGSMAAQEGKLASKMGSGAKVAQAGQGLEETVVVAQEGSMATQEGKLASKMGSGAKVAQAGQGLEEAVVAQEGSMVVQAEQAASTAAMEGTKTGTKTAAHTSASAGGVTNAGEILGKFDIPEYYTYTFGGKSVFVSPNAMKHLTELATHGAGNPNYLKLLGQIHQKALHSAINDVLSRGKITYQKMYYSGGNEIMFAAPRRTGELPAVIHFRQR